MDKWEWFRHCADERAKELSKIVTKTEMEMTPEKWANIFIEKDGVYMNGVLISEPVKVPHPDYEMSRIFWDDATQSVKQEIIPITDIYEQPTNKSEIKK